MKQKIKKIFFYSAWLLRFSLAMLFYIPISLPLKLNQKYKNLWLLSERPDEARDNGYWLYVWITEHYPEINVRFVLSKNSTDYPKMPHKHLIIEPNSASHYINYILSSYSISTHMHGACPGKSFCIPFMPFMRKKKTIFLQHGVTKDKIKLRGKLDAIIASAQQEKTLLAKSNPKYAEKIHIAGMCRYDQLKNLAAEQSQKIILVMPTFRKWLRDIGRLNNPDNYFQKTTYFQKWNNFLQDKNVQRLLRNTNSKIVFFPHKEMQHLSHNFKGQAGIIEIGKPGAYDIQELLKKSSLLITDYSSVLFDFAYMEKPTIFYQFDQKDFFNKHYTSSGKPYPFGPVTKDEISLVSTLHSIVKNNFKMPPKYKKEASTFFAFRDDRNCERNYNVIRKLK